MFPNEISMETRQIKCFTAKNIKKFCYLGFPGGSGCPGVTPKWRFNEINWEVAAVPWWLLPLSPRLQWPRGAGAVGGPKTPKYKNTHERPARRVRVASHSWVRPPLVQNLEVCGQDSAVPKALGKPLRGRKQETGKRPGSLKIGNLHPEFKEEKSRPVCVSSSLDRTRLDLEAVTLSDGKETQEPSSPTQKSLWMFAVLLF